MQRADPVPAPPRPNRTWAERVFGHWWRRQSAARQDRYATLGPLLSVLLFLAAIVSAFWYLRNEEFDREQEAVRRDTEVAQQQVRLRLIENHEQLTRMARELVSRTLDHDAFLVQAAAFTLEHPEVSNLIWLNDRRVRIGGYSGHDLPARDRHQRRRHAGLAADREVGHRAGGSVRARARDAPDRVLAAVPRQLRQPGLPGADPAHRPRRLPRRAAGRVLGRAAAALLRPDRDRAPPRHLGARRARALAREHGDDAAGLVAGPAVDRVRAAGRAGRERPGPARPGLPHLDRPDRQRPVLDGDAAVGAHRLDAARHLAPHAPAPADAGDARLRDQLPARHGELDADRHARHGHGRPHQLRQPGVLRDDRLLRDRPDRPASALPLLAARPHRRERAPARAGAAGQEPDRRHRGQGDAKGRLAASTRACTSRR